MIGKFKKILCHLLLKVFTPKALFTPSTVLSLSFFVYLQKYHQVWSLEDLCLVVCTSPPAWVDCTISCPGCSIPVNIVCIYFFSTISTVDKHIYRSMVKQFVDKEQFIIV